MTGAVLSPVLVLGVLAVVFVVAIFIAAAAALPLMRSKSQVERLLRMNQEALREASEAYSKGLPGLAEEHMTRARLANEELGRLKEQQ